MFTEPKITEIYCMADDFCKEFASQQAEQHERCGDYGDSKFFTFSSLNRIFATEKYFHQHQIPMFYAKMPIGMWMANRMKWRGVNILKKVPFLVLTDI